MDSAINFSLPTACRAMVVMGVSGCGKTSVAAACATQLGWRMYEGDSFHSDASQQKMRAGIALTDADRAGWLDQLATLLVPIAAADDTPAAGVVMTCSALRHRYRDRLRSARPDLGFVFLQLDYEEALVRVRSRPGHLFPPGLVASQFETLESPVGEPGVLTVDATLPLPQVVAAVMRALQPGAAPSLSPTAVPGV